ncbi:hypothetical protein Tco_1265616 [Tanacetum coccineum]
MTTPAEKRNHAKFCEFHGEPKVAKKGETSGKDNALAILMVQPWEKVARQRITQSFSPNPEIFFPPLGEDEGTEGPMIIEAEIGGHCVHRAPSATKPIIEERIKVAINPEYPEQTIMIGSTLIEEGRNKLCGLLQRNLDIFAWKPADMTGVPRHIADHRLNVREGCKSRCSGTSRHSESKTIDTKEHEKRHRSRRSHSPRTSVFSRIRRKRSRSLRQRSKEGGMFKRLGSRGKSVSARSDSYSRNSHSKYTEALSESEDIEGGHWKSRSKKKKLYREEDDLS